MRDRVHSIGNVETPRLQRGYPANVRAVAGVVLLVFATMVLHGNWLLALVLICGGGGAWQLTKMLQQRRQREAVLRDVLRQTDDEFLGFAADLLRAQGYGVLKTGHVDDSRGNLLVMYGNESFACRVLRSRRRLYKTEIVHLLAQMKLYGCKGALILTNRVVSRGAAHFARRVGCVLIDGNALARLILQYRQGHRVYTFQREETAKLRRHK
jgi:hypothetical protein